MKNGLDANIKSMTQAEKTLLRYQYVMSNTNKIQGDFARTAGTWHNQIQILKQQFQQLGAVIGSALIQSLKPFIVQMNAALSGIIKFAQNVVNALGKIFGWRMEVNAKGLTLDDELTDIDTSGIDDTADSADDAATGLDTATKAAKKFKDQLQGFDKLNVLRTTDTSSSSPSSNNKNNKKDDNGNTNAGGVSGGDAIAALKKTKGAFESEIDNLFDLGRYISDTLSKKLAGINWEKVYEKARGFGKGLADFLNGLITPQLFGKVGRTLANCINTAFHFLDSFGMEFNWANFGISIATGINQFLLGLDWGLILHAAQVWAAGLATTINTAVARTDFSMIGYTLDQMLRTALTFLYTFGKDLDWSMIGQNIADGINGFIENFPAKEFADTIDVWVQGIFDLVVNALSNIEWDKLATKIKEFIGNLDFKTVAIVIGGLLLLQGAGFAVTFGPGILAAIGTALGEQLAGSIGISLAGNGGLAAAIGEGLGTATILGISVPIGAIIAAAALLVAGLGIVFATNEQVRKSFEDAIGTLREGLQPAFEFISQTVVPDLQNAFSTLMNILSPIGDFLNDVFVSIWQDMINPALTYIGENVLPMLTDAFEKLWNLVLVPLGGFLASVLGPVIKIVTTVLKILWKNIVVPLAKFIGTVFIKSFELIVSCFSNVLIPAVGFIINIFRVLWEVHFKPLVEWLAATFLPIFDAVFGSIGDIIDGVSQTFSGLIDFITGVFAGDWEKAWGGIKDFFGGIINTVIGMAEGLINGLIGAINVMINAINSISFTVPDWVPDIGGTSFGLGIPNVEYVQLPRVEFEKGGFPRKYSYFMAGEHGKAELLGTVGGKTAVAGGQEITGIRDEINSTGNRQIALLQQQNSILSAILEKEFGISSRDIFNAVRNENQNYTNRTGKSAFSY